MARKRFIVREAVPKDANRMYEVVRAEDMAEWAISCAPGTKFKGNLFHAIKASPGAMVVIDTVTLKPMMLGGAQPNPDGRVLTWLVVSNECMDWALTFMKDYREDLEAFFSRHPKTECYSDSRNVVHHRWLTYLGYELVEEVLWGPFDLPFLHFRKGF